MCRGVQDAGGCACDPCVRARPLAEQTTSQLCLSVASGHGSVRSRAARRRPPHSNSREFQTRRVGFLCTPKRVLFLSKIQSDGASRHHTHTVPHFSWLMLGPPVPVPECRGFYVRCDDVPRAVLARFPEGHLRLW